MFLSRRLHRPISFCLNLSRIQIPTGTLVTNLQSQAWTNVDTLTWCWHVHARQHCFILTDLAHVDWKWSISREKYLKIDSSVKNSVALAYYGSCRLLLMYSWRYMFGRYCTGPTGLMSAATAIFLNNFLSDTFSWWFMWWGLLRCQRHLRGKCFWWSTSVLMQRRLERKWDLLCRYAVSS